MSDGFAYLEELKQQNRGANPGFSSFARYLDTKAREQGVPLSGQFELTPLCNFGCRMCYVHLTKEQMACPLLSADEWKGLMTEACENGMLRAILTGGECLTHPGFREIYGHLKSLGCEVTVLSNAALLDDEWLRYFEKYRPGAICVTLYGDSEDAYERVTGQRVFERVLSHIRAIREAGLPLEISVTPNRRLGEDVFGTIRLAKEFSSAVRVNAWLTKPRRETGRTDQVTDLDDDDYIRIFRYQNELDGIVCTEYPEEKLPKAGGPNHEGEVRGLICGGGRSSFSIDWRGVMSPCNELEMIRAYPLRDGFEPAWRQVHEAALRWPRAIECDGCAYASLCARCAGRLRQFAIPGTRSLRLCERTKRFVRQGVYSVPECE